MLLTCYSSACCSVMCGPRKYSCSPHGWVFLGGVWALPPPLWKFQFSLTFYPLKILALETPTPWEFPVTIHAWGGYGFFWNCTVIIFFMTNYYFVSFDNFFRLFWKVISLPFPLEIKEHHSFSKTFRCEIQKTACDGWNSILQFTHQ